MEIKEHENNEKFAVVAGFNLGLDEKLCSVSLLFKDKEVKLNQEECDELLHVLKGKGHKILAFRNKDEYSAHSAIFTSSMNKITSTEAVVYTEDSIAKV
jgi:hypothetical protein